MAMAFREKNHARWLGVRPAHDGVQVWAAATAENAVVVVYTVPAAKVFFWTGYDFSAGNAGVVAWAWLAEYNAVPALEKYINYLRVPAGGNCVSTKSYWPPVEVPAGKSFRISSAVASLVTAGVITGWEESA